jgi:membrane dipeptidase
VTIITSSNEAAALMRASTVADILVPSAPGGSSAPSDFCAFVDQYRAAGVTWATFTVATDVDASVEASILAIALARSFFLKQSERCVWVESIGDVERAKRDRKLAVALNFQGTNAFAGRLELIEVYRRLGVTMALLCFNEKNAVADGCYERTNAGLSRFGLRVVQEMNRVGMLVDVSHTGRRSTHEAIEASLAPVIMSHSNVAAITDHPRNVTDEQIRAIAAKRGVIGIAGINAMTTGTDNADSISPAAVFQHVDYVAQLVGAAHVGFGLDYIPNTDGLVAWIKRRPETFPADQHRTKMLSAAPQIIEPITGLMLKAGYKEVDVRNVLGDNWLRVFRDASTQAFGKSEGYSS